MLLITCCLYQKFTLERLKTTSTSGCIYLLRERKEEEGRKKRRKVEAKKKEKKRERRAAKAKYSGRKKVGLTPFTLIFTKFTKDKSINSC